MQGMQVLSLIGEQDPTCLKSLLDSVGEGEGWMIWKNGIETCKWSYVKWIASPGSMHETGCSGLVHWEDPEGWDGKGGEGGSGWGTHVHPWWIQVNIWQNQYNIIKLKKKIPHVAGQLSPCATIREPVHSGACVLQLENPHNATTETVHHHKRSCMMQQTSHMPQLRPDTAK